MTEKDKIIQELRRENEELKNKLEESQLMSKALQDFFGWMRDEAFGMDQMCQIVDEYLKDTGEGIGFLS